MQWHDHATDYFWNFAPPALEEVEIDWQYHPRLLVKCLDVFETIGVNLFGEVPLILQNYKSNEPEFESDNRAQFPLYFQQTLQDHHDHSYLPPFAKEAFVRVAAMQFGGIDWILLVGYKLLSS